MPEQTSPPRSRRWLRYLLIVGLVLLALAVSLVVPRCRKASLDKKAAEIRVALESLQKAIDKAWTQNKTISGITIEQALTDAGINDRLKEQWQFAVAWKATEIYTTENVQQLKDIATNEVVVVKPYRMIMASATEKGRLPAGTKLWYDDASNGFHGFGVDDLKEPDWNQVFPNP